MSPSVKLKVPWVGSVKSHFFFFVNLLCWDWKRRREWGIGEWEGKGEEVGREEEG